MYAEKVEPILEDLENKEIEVAGGAVVGMNLATINSLIKYISNLTIGKKKYIDVQDEVERIFNKATVLKEESLKAIDEDKEILEKILEAYKLKKEDENKYIEVCKESVEFCMQVLNIAYETLKLSDEISKVGNKMLSSDFEICKNYSYASVKSAIVNININLESINDEEYKNNVINKYTDILNTSEKILIK